VRVWQGDGWEVREGRWQESAPERVDHVISDPPFDDRTSLGARKTGARKTDFGHEIVRTVTSFMGINPHELAPSFVSIATRWVICFCAMEQLGKYQSAADDAWIRAGAWVKTNPTPQFTGDRPATWGEGIAIMHRKGRKRWNRGGHAALWKSAINTSRERVHETQKPIGLMLAIVSDFTDPGDLVWDPYAGSGTTGVACMRLGRRFLGHEMQPHYAEIAARRLQAEGRGLTLAEADRGQLSILDVIGGEGE
jgi:site-specific DNA-methyltransferase (adenine-specific)